MPFARRQEDREAVAKPLFIFNRIELERLGCLRGQCPVYAVSIDHDGTVLYRGYAHVVVNGERRARANPKKLQWLQSLLDDPAIFWLHSRYAPGHSDCGPWSMNGEVARIAIDAPNFDKHIDHYLGCHGAPQILTRIENAIDAAAGASRWVTGNPATTAVGDTSQ